MAIIAWKMAIAILFFACLPAEGFPYSWWVDDDNTSGPWNGSQAFPFQNIQDGIAASADGDTLFVMPGEYIEKINFLGKAITVKSSEGAASTIINGAYKGSVVTFDSDEGPESILQGFTIKNGTGTTCMTYAGGGGIFCREASPTILDNHITGNQIYWTSFQGGGAGIYCEDCLTPIIRNNTVEANIATQGAGISCYGSSPLIQDNRIVGNTAHGGGGLSFVECPSPIIENNKIQENSARQGGGFYTNTSYPLIKDNTISGNSASFQGGGFCSYSSGAVIENNLFSGNSCPNGGGIFYRGNVQMTITNNIFCNNIGFDGGAIQVVGARSATITNNTITNNTAHERGGGISCWYGASPAITNTILWNNSAPEGAEIYVESGTPVITYSTIKGGWAGDGNMDADPLFVDPQNLDLHLRFSSPCVDGGTNSALDLPETDFEGDPRIVDGNLNGISTVDMGADELLPEIAARFGTVNAASPSLANVLFVNGSFGDNKRIYATSAGTRITMSLLNSPAASIPADFALYWIWWEPGLVDLVVQPERIGISCMPMPLSNLLNGNPPYPPPLTLANTMGHDWLLGHPMIQSLPPAPCTIFDVPQLPPGTYTFQGYIVDNGSACSYGVSLTNAIVLKVQ